MPIVTICAHCGKSFQALKRKSRVQKYCSKECYHRAWEGSHPELYKNKNILCPQCGKEFHPRSSRVKFCSRECSSSYHQNPKQRGQGQTRIIKCLTCGKDFKRYTTKTKYCSHECYTKNNTGENNHAFNNNLTVNENGYLRYSSNHSTNPGEYVHKVVWSENVPYDKCFMCRGEIQVIHHIDKDKQNNEIENLMGLCSSCHGKLHGGRPKKIKVI